MTTPSGLLALARSIAADVIVVGRETPLVDGIADEFRHARVAVFGPSAEAARVEGTKSFAKSLMSAARGAAEGVRAAKEILGTK